MKQVLLIVLALISILKQSEAQTLDAAFAWDADICYFFKGNNVVKYDLKNDKTVAVTTLSEGTFPGVTFSSVDAVNNPDDGYIYFYSGNKYIKFNKAKFRAESGYPKSITNYGNWGFRSTNAALSWPGKTYHFQGELYSRYNEQNKSVDAGYPKGLNSSLWPGLSLTTIEAAFNNRNGKSYLFQGNQYVRYDIATDKEDPGYPKGFEYWPGLEDALSGKSGGKTEDNTDTGDLKITEHTISFASRVVKSPNSVLGKFQIAVAADGGFYFGFQEDNDAVIFKYDKHFNSTGSPIILNNYWLSVMYPMPDGSMAVLAGKDVNNTYIEGYPNTLYFIKVSTSGSVGAAKHIFGGDGHGPQKSWFDGRSKAVIDYNGSEFGIYFEVQKNWADPGEAEDIHNGDMFVVTDPNGNIKSNRTHFWTASHSSTINMAAASSGEFYTMTIGDAHPYGLQVYNRDKDSDFVGWPPKEDYVSYENVNSTNAAGILEFCDENNGELIAVMGTLEHPNIGVFDKVDPLFIKFDESGNTLKKQWLAKTSSDESNISVTPFGKNYAILWGAGNDYDNGWEAQNCTFSVIDTDGNFVKEPQTINKPFGTYSRIISLSDNRLIWSYVLNGENSATVYEIRFE